MPSSYTTSLGIEKPATGEQAGAWGTTLNLNFDLYDEALCGYVQVVLPAAGSGGSPNVLPITDGVSSTGRHMFIEFVDGGDLGGNVFVQLTPNDAEKIGYVKNSLSGGRSILLFQGTYDAARDYVLAQGTTTVVRFSGSGAGSSTVTSILDGLVIGGSLTVTGAFTSLGIDDNANSERLQIGDNALHLGSSVAASEYPVYRPISDGALVIAGGDFPNVGANLRFFGDTHGTQASDIEFRTGSTVRLWWDYSATEWNVSGNPLHNVAGLQISLSEGINYSATNAYLNVNGGTSGTPGGNVRLYGSTHATQAYDVEMRTGSTVRLLYDYSATRWDFQNLPLYNVSGLTVNTTGEILSSVNNSYTVLRGGTAGDGGAIRMYGGAHATQAGDVELLNGTTSVLLSDASASAIVLGVDEIARSVNDNLMTLTGGTTTVPGGQILLYGLAHGTKPNYVEVVSNSALVLQYNNTLGKWDFQDKKIVTTNTLDAGTTTVSSLDATNFVRGANVVIDTDGGIARDVGTDYMSVSGGTSNANGARTFWYGATHSTKANDIEFTAGAVSALVYDYSVGAWDFQARNINNVQNITVATSVILSGASPIKRDVTDSYLRLDGNSSGGEIRLYGSTHSTQAYDIELRSAGNVVGFYDASASEWKFQTKPVSGVTTLTAANVTASTAVTAPSVVVNATTGVGRDLDTSYLFLNGDSAATSGGGNILLYGSSHSTKAGDIELRNWTNTKLAWDQSAAKWTFSGAVESGYDITLTSSNFSTDAYFVAKNASGYALHRDVDNSSLQINGGTVGSSGAKITLNGNASANAYDWYIGAAGANLTCDYSINQLRLYGCVFEMEERAAAITASAGYGQLWVKNTTPCQLWFTDDAGTSKQVSLV